MGFHKNVNSSEALEEAGRGSVVGLIGRFEASGLGASAITHAVMV